MSQPASSTEIEPCDECTGTRWPVEQHEEHCSLYESSLSEKETVTLTANYGAIFAQFIAVAESGMAQLAIMHNPNRKMPDAKDTYRKFYDVVHGLRMAVLTMATQEEIDRVREVMTKGGETMFATLQELDEANDGR